MRNLLPDIIKIRQIALTIDRHYIGEESIIRAILTNPKARKIVIDKLGLAESFLFSPLQLTAKLPKNNPDVEWPDYLDYELDPDKISDFESFLDDDTEEDEFEETNLQKIEYKSLKDFIQRVLDNTEKEDWKKDKIVEEFVDAEKLFDQAKQHCIEKYPYFGKQIDQLVNLLLTQHSCSYDNDINRAIPVFVLSKYGNYVYEVLEDIAAQIGCRFISVEGGMTTRSELDDILSEKGSSLLMIPNIITQTSSNDALSYIISYFENGNIPYEQQNKSFLLLDVIKDDNHLLKTLLKFQIIVIVMQIPENLSHINNCSPKEIFYEIKQQDEFINSDNDIKLVYKKLDNILQDYNTVVFPEFSTSQLLEFTISEIHNRNKFLCFLDDTYNFRFKDIDKFATIIIMTLNTRNPKYITEFIANILHNILNKLRKYSKKEKCTHSVIIQSNLLFLDRLLEIDSKKDLVTYLENSLKQFKLNRDELTFDIEYGKSSKQISICRFKIRKRQYNDNSKFLIQRPKIRFKDVVGFSDAKKRFNTLIDYIKDPDPYNQLQIKPVNRILLVGEPGTGKTLLAKAFAGESNIPFFSLSASEITSQKYAGEGAILLRKIFNSAKNFEYAIIFLDELDAFGRRANMDSDSVAFDARSIMNTLLVLLDGIEDNNIIVIGATNRPKDLDNALLRHKRFGTRINANPLNPQDRKQLIKLNLKQEQCEDDYEQIVSYITRRTMRQFTPVNIEQIINEAKLYAIENDDKKLRISHFKTTIDRKLLGNKYLPMTKEYRISTSYHESGHALLLKIFQPKLAIEKISIGYRMNNVGALLTTNEEIAAEEITLKTIISHIMIKLAGPAAEKIHFGSWQSGAENDFDEAIRLSLAILANYDLNNGFSSMVQISLLDIFNENLLTSKLEKEVKKITNICFEKAYELLQKHKRKLDILAEKLMEKEDMNDRDVEKIIGEIKENTNLILEQIVEKIRNQ